MKQTVLISCAIIVGLFALTSCGNDFKKLPGGVEYKILKSGEGKENIKIGDVITIHMINLNDKDSAIMDSHKKQPGSNGQPFQVPVKASRGKYDIMAWVTSLKKGDSAIYLIPVDSVFPKDEMRPQFFKAHTKMKLTIAVVDKMSEAQAQQKQMDEMKAEATKEDAMIQSYITEKGLKDVQKTPEGLYYIITKKGTGANAATGETASMNYRGSLLNGKMFDSNLDTIFHHVQPFEFKLNQHQVIQGWDIGVALLNKGAKATFIVPSVLGYGPQDRGDRLPANSVLVFDVELLNIKK